MTSVTPTPTELEQLRRLNNHHLLLLIDDLQRTHGWCVARQTLQRLTPFARQAAGLQVAHAAELLPAGADQRRDLS